MHVRPIGLITVGGIDKYASLSVQELDWMVSVFARSVDNEAMSPPGVGSMTVSGGGLAVIISF